METEEVQTLGAILSWCSKLVEEGRQEHILEIEMIPGDWHTGSKSL